MSYDSFAQYRAALDRLTSFMDANQQARDLPSIDVKPRDDAMVIENMVVSRPDGHVLAQGVGITLTPGQSMLIKGASGSGKTTLLRTLAGLWPHAQGTVWRPVDHSALFLSQRPYLPLGNLRSALSYPSLVLEDAAIQDALVKVHLGHLLGKLDEPADWSNILSLGEQQRLAFARVLLNKPRIAFLDEATSATDEGLEHALYTLLRTELPQCMLVSVGHRSTLDSFHSHQLALKPGGQWTFQSA